MLKLDLDGLVVIGGDDSNTNACLLAENFRFIISKFFQENFAFWEETWAPIYLFVLFVKYKYNTYKLIFCEYLIYMWTWLALM